MMTDPIADMLTRVRNANRIERPYVDMPATNLKVRIAQVLKEEGFIDRYELGKEVPDEQGHTHFQEVKTISEPHVLLRVVLKYGPDGERVIRHIARASRPGRRLYRNHTQLRPVLDGLGIAILTTSRGVLSDRTARAQRVGGELLCTVW
jgi:small subunit ribosomal protein S8